MENETLSSWASPLLDQFIKQAKDYKEIALYETMKEEIEELDKRYIQAQNQLDQLGWDKSDWTEDTY